VRVRSGFAERAASRIAGLGYAIPGVVIAVGVMVPLTRWTSGSPQCCRPEAHRRGSSSPGTVLALPLRVSRAVSRRRAAIGGSRARKDPAQHGRRGAQPRRRPAETLARVHAPLLARSLTAAALLVFVDVMKELPATLALRPFDFDTLAVQTFNLAKDERLAEASIPALAIVAVGLIPVYLLARSMARR
jgi:iron(III) transport system permease protein